MTRCHLLPSQSLKQTNKQTNKQANHLYINENLSTSPIFKYDAYNNLAILQQDPKKIAYPSQK